MWPELRELRIEGDRVEAVPDRLIKDDADNGPGFGWTSPAQRISIANQDKKSKANRTETILIVNWTFARDDLPGVARLEIPDMGILKWGSTLSCKLVENEYA